MLKLNCNKINKLNFKIMPKKNTTIDDLAVMVQKGFIGVDKKMEAGFKNVDKKFENVDKKFDEVNQRLIKIDSFLY